MENGAPKQRQAHQQQADHTFHIVPSFPRSLRAGALGVEAASILKADAGKDHSTSDKFNLSNALWSFSDPGDIIKGYRPPAAKKLEKVFGFFQNLSKMLWSFENHRATMAAEGVPEAESRSLRAGPNRAFSALC